MKKQFKVDTVITRLYCDTCNIEMIKEGVIFGVEPQQFSYQCPICKKKEINMEQHPRVDYIPRKTLLDRLKIWSRN